MATTMTLLNAVNICLRAVGESPVSSADTEHPYAIAARDIIDNKNKDIQSQGWYFNTQRNVKLTPTTEGEILLPSTTLAIDTSDKLGSMAVRGNRLIDLYLQTDRFTDAVYLDIVEEVPFDELPYVAAKAIAYLSAVEMQRAYEMEPRKLESYLQEYQMATIELKKQERRNRNSNSLHNSVSNSLANLMPSSGRSNPNLIGGR